MIYEYSGSSADILVEPDGPHNGFYTLTVTTTYNGEQSVWKESVPIQALRNRADSNNTNIQTERDAFIADAMTRAQDRFNDVVDLEVL